MKGVDLERRGRQECRRSLGRETVLHLRLDGLGVGDDRASRPDQQIESMLDGDQLVAREFGKYVLETQPPDVEVLPEHRVALGRELTDDGTAIRSAAASQDEASACQSLHEAACRRGRDSEGGCDLAHPLRPHRHQDDSEQLPHRQRRLAREPSSRLELRGERQDRPIPVQDPVDDGSLQGLARCLARRPQSGSSAEPMPR